MNLDEDLGRHTGRTWICLEQAANQYLLNELAMYYQCYYYHHIYFYLGAED